MACTATPTVQPSPNRFETAVAQLEATIVASSTATAPSGVTPTLAPAVLPPGRGSLKAASVVNVVDGDTIDAVIDGAERRVRYIGIDTPRPFILCLAKNHTSGKRLRGIWSWCLAKWCV